MEVMTDEVPELTEEQFKRAIPARLRAKFVRGEFDSGSDIARLRRFVGLTQRSSPRRWASAFTPFGTGNRVAGDRRGPRLVSSESLLVILVYSGRTCGR